MCSARSEFIPCIEPSESPSKLMSTFLNFTFVQREVHILFRISRNCCLYFHLRRPRLLFSQPCGDACRRHGRMPRKSQRTFLLFPLQPFKLQLPPTRYNMGTKLCAQEDGTVLLCVFPISSNPSSSVSEAGLLTSCSLHFQILNGYPKGRLFVENIWEFPCSPKEKTLVPERTGLAVKWQSAFNILPGNGAL